MTLPARTWPGGGPGSDSFTNGTGNDKFYGNGGNDLLLGHRGVDKMHGGAGDDRLDGNDFPGVYEVTDLLGGGTNTAAGDTCVVLDLTRTTGCEKN